MSSLNTGMWAQRESGKLAAQSSEEQARRMYESQDAGGPTPPLAAPRQPNACTPTVSAGEKGYAVSRLRYARKKSTCWYKEGC